MPKVFQQSAESVQPQTEEAPTSAANATEECGGENGFLWRNRYVSNIIAQVWVIRLQTAEGGRENDGKGAREGRREMEWEGDGSWYPNPHF